jgi:hypothetical protein
MKGRRTSGSSGRSPSRHGACRGKPRATTAPPLSHTVMRFGVSMRAILGIALVFLTASPAVCYQGLSEALEDVTAADGVLRPSSQALEYILEHCGLDESPEWDGALRSDGGVLGGVVSENRQYCVLTNLEALYASGGWQDVLCLVGAELGWIWAWHPPYAVASVRVSDRGAIAVFGKRGDSVVFNADGDTLFARRWPDYVRRRPHPRSYEFGEVSAFSPGGQFLAFTMNRAGGDSGGVAFSNTYIYCLDLESRAEHVEGLGEFWPVSLRTSEAGADLRGHTREYIEWRIETVGDFWTTGLKISDPFVEDAGPGTALESRQPPDDQTYQLTWVPWGVEKGAVRGE